MRARLFTLGVALALVAAFGAQANALQVSYTNTIPLQGTDWTQNLNVTKFNSALGVLTSIQFDLTGSILGSAAVENLNPTSGATVNTSLSAVLKLMRPDLSVLLSVAPAAQVTNTVLGPFDGTIDGAGTSGATFTNLSSTGSSSFTTAAASDLAAFTGVGTIALPTTATGASTATGGGNLTTQFFTDAGATVKVTYNYQDQSGAPEPCTLAFVGLAMAAVGLRRRRRGANPPA